jgi:hypothetical protein
MPISLPSSPLLTALGPNAVSGGIGSVGAKAFKELNTNNDYPHLYLQDVHCVFFVLLPIEVSQYIYPIKNQTHRRRRRPL